MLLPEPLEVERFSDGKGNIVSVEIFQWGELEKVCALTQIWNALLKSKNHSQIYKLNLQFNSVPQSCPTLCDPMNRSTPGLPVHHQLPEFTETHIHRVSDAIQPSHPLSSPSPPAPNPSQHQSFPVSQLFAWGGRSTGVSALASLPPKKSQGWSPFRSN